MYIYYLCYAKQAIWLVQKRQISIVLVTFGDFYQYHLLYLVVVQQTPVMDLSAVYVLVTLSKVLFQKWKPNEQEIFPVGCFLTAKVASIPERGWDGGRYTLFPLDTLHPKYLPYGYPTPWFHTSQYPTPWKGNGTWCQGYPIPCAGCGQNDRCLWKHYLPGTSLAVGNKCKELSYRSST